MAETVILKTPGLEEALHILGFNPVLNVLQMFSHIGFLTLFIVSNEIL